VALHVAKEPVDDDALGMAALGMKLEREPTTFFGDDAAILFLPTKREWRDALVTGFSVLGAHEQPSSGQRLP
jgi:hypothetical protein